MRLRRGSSHPTLCPWPDSNFLLSSSACLKQILTCTDIFRKKQKQKQNMHCLIWCAPWQRWTDCVSSNFRGSLGQGDKLNSMKTHWGGVNFRSPNISIRLSDGINQLVQEVFTKKHPRLESNWHLQQIGGPISHLSHRISEPPSSSF